MKKNLNIDYSCIHGSYWMLFGCVMCFASAFLLEAGYTNGEIGVLLAVANVAAVFLQPIIADFADQTKKFTLVGVIQICTVVSMILAAGLFVFTGKSLAVWMLFMLLTAWATTLQPLLNSLNFRLREQGHPVNFALCRSVGSLSYAIICALLGTLVARHGTGVVPVASEIVLVALMASLLLIKYRLRDSGIMTEPLPDRETAEMVPELVLDQDDLQSLEDDTIDLAAFLRRNKLFVAMHLGVALLFFHNSILNNYMLQVVTAVGGDSEDMGRVLSLLAFLEIPTLIFFQQIRKRLSLQFLLKLAAVCFTIKVLLVYLAQSMTLIYIAHLFQACSFALFLPAMVAFTDDIMRKGEAVKGQAWFTVMTTVSSILASVSGGFLLDLAGPKFMLLTATVVTAMGAAVVILLIDRIPKK